MVEFFLSFLLLLNTTTTIKNTTILKHTKNPTTLLLLVVPSPDLILVLKHPLYLHLHHTKNSPPSKHVYDPAKQKSVLFLYTPCRILPLFYILFQFVNN